MENYILYIMLLSQTAMLVIIYFLNKRLKETERLGDMLAQGITDLNEYNLHVHSKTIGVFEAVDKEMEKIAALEDSKNTNDTEEEKYEKAVEESKVLNRQHIKLVKE